MNRRFLTIVVLAMLMLPAGLVGVGADHPAPGTIVVTTTEDELNADGDCSLREAIFAANINDYVDACGFGSGDDIIVLPAGIYALTITTEGWLIERVGIPMRVLMVLSSLLFFMPGLHVLGVRLPYVATHILGWVILGGGILIHWMVVRGKNEGVSA